MNNDQKRKLGRSNIEVSAIGAGCWAIGGPNYDENGKPVFMGQAKDEESIKAVQRALELGITFFDTAEGYGKGHSEEILGQALQEYRDDVVISTKFFISYDQSKKSVNYNSKTPKEFLQDAVNKSLARLKTDYIDLYLLHTWGLPIEFASPIRDILDDLVDDGTIRTYGWSTDALSLAKFFAERPNCSAIEHELNVLVDMKEILDLCEKNNLASINRTVLAMGLLTGKYTAESTISDDDIRGKYKPEWVKYFDNAKPHPEYLAKLQKIEDVLTRDGRTIVQGALGWVLARSDRTIPIPGFRTVKQIEENSKTLEFGSLSPGQMKEIDEILGERNFLYDIE